MGIDFHAHQRHADEIGDPLLLDQLHRFLCIPLVQHHQLAADGVADQYKRHRGGHVEQRDADHRGRLAFGHGALLFHDVDEYQYGADKAHRALHHGPVFGIGALGPAGRTRGEQDRCIVLRCHLRQRGFRTAAFFDQRLQTLERRHIMLENRQLCAMIAVEALKPGSALRIGEHDRTTDILDAIGQFITLPPAVQLGAHAAGQGDRHVEDYPVGRVARRDPDPVALLDAPAFDKPAGKHPRRGIGFAKGKPDVAIDQELRILVHVAEIGEIIGHILRCILEDRHVDAEFRYLVQFQHLAGLRQLRQRLVNHCIQLRCRHFSRLPLPPACLSYGVLIVPLGMREFPFIWTRNDTGKRVD